MSRAQRTIPLTLISIAVAAMFSAACTGPPAAASPSSGPASGEGAGITDDSAPAGSLVGMWMQVHTCDQLVAGLEEYGLGETAPAIVGDFFPDVPVEELAAKEDLCAGAKPQRHFHFFDAVGAFGSLDQYRQQVDDGSYYLDGDQLEIGEGTWRVDIEGNHLSLTPLIPRAQRRQALAHPLDWSVAGWVVAVAYPGTTWQRVPCDGWC